MARAVLPAESQNLFSSGSWKASLAHRVKPTSLPPVPVPFDLAASDLIGLDYLFVFAVPFSLHAMHGLLAVREEGEAEQGVVLNEFYGEVRKAVRYLSNLAGRRHPFTFPFAKIEEPDKPQQPVD